MAKPWSAARRYYFTARQGPGRRPGVIVLYMAGLCHRTGTIPAHYVRGVYSIQSSHYSCEAVKSSGPSGK